MSIGINYEPKKLQSLEIDKLTEEFFANDGHITEIDRRVSGLDKFGKVKGKTPPFVIKRKK